MVSRIVLIGALPGDPVRADILGQLRERSGSMVDWDWIRAEVASGGRPNPKDMNRLLTDIQRRGKSQSDNNTTIVKLPILRPESINTIHKCCDPVRVPLGLSSFTDIIEWLFSDDANLIPRNEWYGTLRESALVALLSKLIRNKSWNKDTQGHAWTTEENLLNQAPVLRSTFQSIAVESRRMLPKLSSGLLICKGGTAGTPREWCIRLEYVGAAKSAIIGQNLTQLLSIQGLEAISHYIYAKQEGHFRLDGEIASEKVRGICRAQNH